MPTNNSESIIQTTIIFENFEIPIKLFTRLIKVPKGLWISKSAVVFQNWQNRKITLFGFGIANSKNDSMQIAKYELLERFLATYDMAPKLGYKGDLNYLFGAYPSCGNQILDASGLAFHNNMQSAIEHAQFEVIERHLLAKIWYKGGLLSKVGNSIIINEELSLQRYTACGIRIPFVVSVIKSTDGNIWLCGSSIRNNFSSAIQKADFEAYMLLDGILNNNSGMCTNPETREIVLSLSNPEYSISRSNHWNKHLSEKKYSFESEDYDYVYDSKTIMASVFSPNANLTTIPIIISNNGIVVRVVCDEALKVKDFRKSIDSKGIPKDPFC